MKAAHAEAADAACCAFFRRLYHVERETPSASHGCFAGRRSSDSQREAG